MWQAEADTELTLSASPTTAVGQKALALAKRRYSTVILLVGGFVSRNLQTHFSSPKTLYARTFTVLCYMLQDEGYPSGPFH